jgi:hypothetical protein
MVDALLLTAKSLYTRFSMCVSVNTPLITVSLPRAVSQTISFEVGLSGAWSAVYSDTIASYSGIITNTWGEFTFGEAGVVDVSRLPHMSGHPMSIVGPTCTADINTCVFLCNVGEVCMDNYTLQNCANGSQTGANFGYINGTESGGCGWNGAASAALKTSFL